MCHVSYSALLGFTLRDQVPCAYIYDLGATYRSKVPFNLPLLFTVERYFKLIRSRDFPLKSISTAHECIYAHLNSFVRVGGVLDCK